MELKEKTFYVFKYDGSGGLFGYGADGVSKDKAAEIIFFNNEKIEFEFKDKQQQLQLREATELEKEYWMESMESADEFDAVSLCDFEEWKKQKK